MNSNNNVGSFMKIEEPPSGRRSFSDYSARFKKTTVSPEDELHFYRKYHGFIIDYCRSECHLPDCQIQDILDIVLFDKFFAGGRKTFDRRDGRFLTWFKTVIRSAVMDYFRQQKRQQQVDGKYLISLKASRRSKHKDDDQLWREYLACLAYEKACERSTEIQRSCFTLKYNSLKPNDLKPAEIAVIAEIDPRQVSEHIRAFKNKVKTAYKELDSSFDPKKIDWREFALKAGEAQKKFAEIGAQFKKEQTERYHDGENNL